MKQFSTALSEERPSVRLAFLLWKRYKGYNSTGGTPIGEYLEIIDTFSTNHKKEWSDGRFFGHILLNHESSVAWEGEELVDILHYEACEIIKKRLTRP